MRVTGPAWLFYDADCRICSSLARWVRRLDLRHAIVSRPLQAAAGMLAGIPGDEILDAMRAIGRDGLVHEGGEGLLVVAAAFFDGSALEAILLRSSFMRRAARRTYALLVEFRGHLVCRIPEPEATSAGRSGRGGP
jgi:predicted DCC family thiol-disulfide oxidoreductase YuxK